MKLRCRTSADRTAEDWVTGARDNDAVNMVLLRSHPAVLTFGLAIIGFVMVTAASIPIGQRLADDPFLFAKRDALYLGLAFGLSLVTLRIPMEIWQRYGNVMLLMSIVMLLIVLVVGSSVNGASRWIALGRCVFSPRRLSKLSLFCSPGELSGTQVERGAQQLLKLLQADGRDGGAGGAAAGAAGSRHRGGAVHRHAGDAVLAGAKMWQFLAVIGSGVFAVVLIIAEPYRMRRVTSFWNRWADPFGGGHSTDSADGVRPRRVLGGRARQLGAETGYCRKRTPTHLLHFGEELGYIGVVLALLMVFFVAFALMSIGRRALESTNALRLPGLRDRRGSLPGAG